MLRRLFLLLLIPLSVLADDIQSKRHITTTPNDGTYPYVFVRDEGILNLAGPAGLNNPSFESGTTGWTASGVGASIAQSSSDAWVGSNSLEVTVTGTNNTGVIP